MANMIQKYVVFTKATKNIVGCYSRAEKASKQAKDANNAICRIQYETGYVLLDPATLQIHKTMPDGLKISQIDGVFK